MPVKKQNFTRLDIFSALQQKKQIVNRHNKIRVFKFGKIALGQITELKLRIRVHLFQDFIFIIYIEHFIVTVVSNKLCYPHIENQCSTNCLIFFIKKY